MFKKPQKPFKNIQEAKQHIGFYPSVRRRLKICKNFYPCINCFGIGETIDLNEIPVQCSECHGSGEIDRDKFMIWYYSEMETYKLELNVFNKAMRIIKNAIKLLDKTELLLLREYFNENTLSVWPLVSFLKEKKIKL